MTGRSDALRANATFADGGKNAHFAGHINGQHPARGALASITPQFPMAVRDYPEARGQFPGQSLEKSARLFVALRAPNQRVVFGLG